LSTAVGAAFDSVSACPDKTRHDLEWDRLLSAIADRCVGPMGRDLALALPFPPSVEAATVALAESREAFRLLEAGEPLPAPSAADAREAIERTRAHGVLSAGELRAIAAVLASARTLRRFLTSRRPLCPSLFAACATDPTLDALGEELAAAFDADGTLADRASPRLRELRAEYQAARQRLLNRLDDLMGRYESILQDRFVTEREGRYVLPVRSDAHERFPGIVHGASASGATLFVEPRAVIPMGNRLKMLEAEVAREEIAIYTRLSGLVEGQLASVTAAAEAVAWADVRAAVAKLASELGMAFPEIAEEPLVDLRNARHPLLLLDLDPAEVVPSDLTIAAGRAMVISGPNAGGKTVALKTLGLAALLVRAGLPVPCDEGSRIGLFEQVLTDVGDDQSLQKNLSTFSAHVGNLVSILEATHRGTLVLLDELAGGTDPREGEALAAGVLDSLCARGGAVAVTTHYEGLKALALADARFDNASVGFDLATLTPSFRLAIGVPGSSSALAVARKYGMPGTVLERAERYMKREDQHFETVVKRLHDERAALELARHAAETREREADKARVRLEAELEATRSRETQMLSREAEALLARIRRAREDLHVAQAKLRAKKADEVALKEASRTLDRLSGEVAVGGELEALVSKRTDAPRDAVRPEALRKGARVYVARLRAEAEVVEVLQGGNVRVAAGPLKLVVPPGELMETTPEEPPAAKARPERVEGRRGRPQLRSDAGRRGLEAQASPPAPEQAESRLEVPIQTSDNSVDLRGLRTEDALSLANTFLDRALNEGQKVVFLVHGHGTGALRDAIRKDLRESRYVAFFRAGGRGEGGDGVTIAWLT
jgi:DNA mismatch repair protein MutS2